MTAVTAETVEVPAYRGFTVQVARVQRLSPSFARFTFTGADLDLFACHGPDQRIKVILPLPGRGLADFPDSADWYGAWRALPDERRMPIRTYTVRAARPEAREVDVDFVLHGATGPASAWAETASVGDEVILIGPDVGHSGPTGGYEWHPPADASCLLVAGDETAVPAICAIVESLPAGQRARVLLEVPETADVLPLAPVAGVEVTWLPRSAGGPVAAHGELLTAAVADAVRDLADDLAPSSAAALEDVDIDAGILWEVPVADVRADSSSGVYAWLAGEAAVVKTLRRHLVQEVGVDRRSVAFMGYWREGRQSD